MLKTRRDSLFVNLLSSVPLTIYEKGVSGDPRVILGVNKQLFKEDFIGNFSLDYRGADLFIM